MSTIPPEEVTQLALGGGMVTMFGWLVLQLLKLYMGIIRQKDKDIERLEQELDSRDKRTNKRISVLETKVKNGKSKKRS